MSTAFRVIVEGTQEVPANASTATGLGTVIFDSAAVAASYSIRVQGLDFGLATGGTAQTPETIDDATRTHFHNAARGTNGSIVFGQIGPPAERHDEDLEVLLNADGSWTISGRWETTDTGAPRSISEFAAILDSTAVGSDAPLYFNIHTAQFPGGAIRGQLVAIADDNDNVVEGTAGHDLLPGLDGNDVLDGGAGNDLLVAGGGTDFVLAGDGNDNIFGGAGNDAMLGGADNDQLVGGEGNDGIYGGAGSDFLYGGTGDDYISTDAGDDVGLGGDGNDQIILGAGSDYGYGGAGNDYIYADADGDVMFGGAGNDVGLGGAGNDVAFMDEGDDYTYGQDGADFLFGGTGNDVLFGGAGSDSLNGGDGDDYFDGGEGINYYVGGAGNDQFGVTNVAGVQVVEDFITGGSEDYVTFIGSGLTSLADVLAKSSQAGSYLVVTVDADTAVWLNNTTAATLTAGDLAFI